MLQPGACKSELIGCIILVSFNLHRSLYNAAIGSSGVVRRQHHGLIHPQCHYICGNIQGGSAEVYVLNGLSFVSVSPTQWRAVVAWLL